MFGKLAETEHVTFEITCNSLFGSFNPLIRTNPFFVIYCWFSYDVTKIQTTKLSILLRYYFHDVLEQLKTNFHTNFRFKRVLGFVIEYA